MAPDHQPLPVISPFPFALVLIPFAGQDANPLAENMEAANVC